MSQVKNKFIESNAVDDLKLRLRNNQYLRARNAAGTDDVSVIKLNASDVIEFASLPQANFAPSSAADLVNKAYVDGVAQGLDIKASVRVATTADISLSGTQTIDGVSVVAGDRVLVKSQSSGSQNGIYVAAAGAWSRAVDADSSAKVTAGLFVFVEEGSAHADTGWVLSSNQPITLDTTALSFTQFSGAGSITAGAGLTKSGNTIDVVAGDSSIDVQADSVAVATGGITSAKLAATSVTAAKLGSDVAGNGLQGGNGSAISAKVDGVTVKVNNSGQLESYKPKKEAITLNSTDISNQYKDLAYLAATDSVMVSVSGVIQYEGVDYSLSTYSGVTRISLLGDLASGGNAALVSGDVLRIQYLYL